MTGAPEVPPDTKDWTWVLDRPCPECRFDPQDLADAELGPAVRDSAAGWRDVVADRQRPAPLTWSPLEYACHVRDVNRLFAERLRLLLTQDDPLFANWDQDQTAVEQRYAEQDPAQVADELERSAEGLADALDAVRPEQWSRPGRRSNGSSFTASTLARYCLHDLVHHRCDVGL